MQRAHEPMYLGASIRKYSAQLITDGLEGTLDVASRGTKETSSVTKDFHPVTVDVMSVGNDGRRAASAAEMGAFALSISRVRVFGTSEQTLAVKPMGVYGLPTAH